MARHHLASIRLCHSGWESLEQRLEVLAQRSHGLVRAVDHLLDHVRGHGDSVAADLVAEARPTRQLLEVELLGLP